MSGGVWVFWNCFTRSACRKHLLGASWWYQTAHLSSFSSQRFHLLLGLLIDAFCKIVRPSQQFQKKNLFLLMRVLRMNSISYPQDDYFILIHIYYLAFAHFFTLKHFASFWLWKSRFGGQDLHLRTVWPLISFLISLNLFPYVKTNNIFRDILRIKRYNICKLLPTMFGLVTQNG